MAKATEKPNSIPYDVENTERDSVKLLYKCFCNNLQLGQWEVARSCILRFKEKEDILGKDIGEILLEVAENPYEQSLGSNTLSCPSKLSWLCLLECHQLSDKWSEEKILLSSRLAKDADFRLLLAEIPAETESTIIQELYEYAQVSFIHQVKTETPLPNVHLLSKASLNFLKDLLLSKTDLSHLIITHILIPDATHAPATNTDFTRSTSATGGDNIARNNEALQGLYIQCINSVLDHVEKTTIKQAEKLELFSKLLSYYDPLPYWNYLQLRQLFARLIEFCESNENPLTKDAVVSLLMGRKVNYLIEEFSKVEYELTIEAAKSDLETNGLSEEERCVLHVCYEEDKQNRWRNLFLLSTKKQKHFLEMIFNTALSLVKMEKFNLLEKLLNTEELKPLKPMVLLIGWSYCSSCNMARELLSILWDDNEPCQHTALTSSCKKLSYQIDLIQWCLDKAKPLIESSSGTSMASHERATNMLQNLSTHSVLFVLHQSTRLSALSPNEVLQLLQNTSHCDGQEKKKKSVRFNDEKVKETKSKEEPISIEQQCDISIFRSYCALKNIMDIMAFCAENYEHELMNPVCVRFSLRTKHLTKIFSLEEGVSSSSDGEDWLSASQTGQVFSDVNMDSAKSFENLYDTNVTKKMAATKNHLRLLYPLTLRVETLENILSLLFLTHEDFNSEFVQDMDSGEEEDEAGSKRNSMENMALISDEDVPTHSRNVSFTKTNTESVVASKSLTATAAYDEPFEERKPAGHASQSLHQLVTIPQNHLADVKASPKKKLSLTLTSLRRMSTLNKSSDVSSSLTSQNVKIGFLANEYIVRDVIAMLKESLVDLTTTRLKLSSQEEQGKDDSIIDPSLEKTLAQHVKSTISTDQLQQRITRITQLIHEAQWRFQLVCHEQVPRQAGVLLQKPVVSSDNITTILSANSSPRRSRSKSPKTEPTVSSDEDENKHSGTSNKGVKCSNVQLRSQSTSLSSVTVRSPGIINLMLSSPASLLSMCLSKGNFGQAAQVVKLFKLEKKDDILEVTFSDAFKKAANTLCSLVDNPGKSSSSVSSRPGKMSMKALGSVAAAGMASASLTNITDDLLSGSGIPQLPRANLPKSNKMQIFFTEINVSVAILVDLLITSCKTWELCNKMMEVIKSKMNLKNLTSVDPERQGIETSLVGCRVYLAELQKLLQLSSVQENQMAFSGEADGSKHSSVLKQSLRSMMTTATCPMSADQLKNFVNVKEEMNQLLDRAVQVLLEMKQTGNGDLSMEESTASSSPLPSPEPSPCPSPLSSVSSRSSFRMETPAMHTVMKQLITGMVKFVPTGGILRLLKRSSSSMVSTNRNYLLSLYDHVKELAFVVAQSESKAQETIVLPKNYFKMLQEGPISILGRLMFNKKLQPARLEKVASQLSLNLTHIIVHSCCPRIPSKPVRPILPHSSSQQECKDKAVGTKIVYNNMEPVTKITEKSAEKMIREILESVVRKMKDVAGKSNAKEIFDIMSAKLFVQDPGYNDLMSDVGNLRDCDLDTLKSSEEKSSFFINLHNLMSIHMHLHYTHQLILKQIMLLNEEKGGSLTRSEEIFSMSSLDHLIYRQQFSYVVGQLGRVSLGDIQQIIFPQKFHPFHRANDLIFPKFSQSYKEPWSRYCPPLDDRLIFLHVDGCISSPHLQVVCSESLSNQLQITMKEYINMTVSVNADMKEVKVNQYLMWFKESQISERKNSKPTYSKLKEVIDFILNYLDGSKRDMLQELMNNDVNKDGSTENIDTAGRKELPFSVIIQPFNPEFSVVFSAECLLSAESIGIPRSKPALLSRCESSIDSLLQKSGSSVENPSYLLTPTTLDYIKSDSLLVATMVSLVCADELDEIDQHFTDDYFRQDSFPKNRTMSDISLVDIRSYRYQRLTDDFPVLQRHLLNYILPLAGADNPDISSHGDPILKFVTNDIDEKVKLCMFSLHDSLQFQDVVNEMILDFLKQEKFLSILPILRSIPESVMFHKPSWQIIHDFVIMCLTQKTCQSLDCDQQVFSLLRYFYCVNCQVQTILSVCDYLPLDTAIDLLELCLSQNIAAEFIPVVEEKLQVLNIYAKIIDSVKTLQFKLSMATSEMFSVEEKDMVYHSALEPYNDWHYLVKTSQDSPKDVLAVLMKTGIFLTAKTWSEMNNVPKALKLEIDERYLVSLLTSESTDAVQAFQLLESIRKEDVTVCLTLCENLLQKLPDHRDILFLTSYMLNQLSSTLRDNKQDLQLRHIGAKALQCLPSSLRGDYSGLITSPHLILEQLLMNLKADLAGQVYSKMKDEFLALKDKTLRISVDQFNDMLIKYAKLAVEVTVVQFYPDRERSFSTESTEQRKDESELQKSFMESVRIRRRGLDLSVSPRTPGTSTPSASPMRRGSSLLKPLPDGAISINSGAGKFVMPALPPPPDKWVPDEAASVCMVCNVERFSMFSRRHHCRRCGRVVCASCSSKRAVVQGVSARVCDDCYQQIFGAVDQKAKEEEFYSKTPDRVSQSSTSPQPYCSSVHSMASPTQDGDMLNITIQGESEWKLKSDENFNKLIREEFYYEQAPSVSLSISILNHHSNGVECGHVLLKMCDDLSKYLQPIAPGVPNPEVDYSLIISMMKQLLFQAKMKFLSLGDNKSIGQCDMYQTRVDLLKILVEANYRNLPTIEELTKVDTVRRLRDKLISDERLGLAMEVSTKCGLDSSGVWAAWGMALLQCGNYTGAREKFSHCLKAPKDKNQTTISSRLLQEVVDHLETLPATGATEIQMLLSSPASIKSLINMPASTSVEESSMETIQFQESLYYLKTYGTYLELLQFLRRNGYWMKAAEYVVQHKCMSDVFIEGLLVPALNAGDLDKLLDQIVMLDKSLEKWSHYLTATCRHLLKHRLHHVLYKIQIFMKDYLRAAMTCISHFYQQGCQSYLDLAKRIQFLFTAQQHMQAYLDPSKWGSVKHPFNSSSKKSVDWNGSPAENSVRLSLSPDEVNKHIRTIALQIEVSQYLDQCLKKMSGDATALAESYVVESCKSNLPTLFGNSKMRTELVTMILQSGDSIQSGFDLSIRIIKECRLSSSAIFTHTARELAKRQHYSSIKELLDVLHPPAITLSDDDSDEIVRAALLVLADKQEEAKETENLIKLLKKDTNKINAYILCGKLRSAYLLAVKSDRVDDVQRIAGAAQRTGQAAVRNICSKWLQQRKK